LEKEQKDVFFVELEGPEELRRDILECLKDIIECMQKYEKFKDLRKQKSDNIKKLGKDIRSISRIVSSLKNYLPDTKIKALKENDEIMEKRKSSAKVIGGIKKKHVVELQKLETELTDIEEKLSSLK